MRVDMPDLEILHTALEAARKDYASTVRAIHAAKHAEIMDLDLLNSLEASLPDKLETLRAANGAVNEAERLQAPFFMDPPERRGANGETLGDVAYVSTLRQMVSSRLPDIIRKLVKLAESGDTNAARILMDKVLPSVKPVEAPVQLKLDQSKDLAEQVLVAITDGSIGIQAGSDLMRAMAAVQDSRQNTEFQARMAALELKAQAMASSRTVNAPVLRIPSNVTPIRRDD